MKPQPRMAPTSPSRMSVRTPSSSARTASSVWIIARRCCDLGERRLVGAGGPEVGEAGPEAGALALVVVGVEAGLGLAAEAALVGEDRRDVVGGALGVGVAEGGLRGLGDLHAEVDRGFVDELQRAERKAELAGGVLDEGGGDALGDHAHPLVEVGDDAAVGVEEAGVVDDDRGLPDLADEVERLGDGAVGGFGAADDLDEGHLLDGREEVDAEEVGRVAAGVRQAGDRQGRGVGGEDGVQAETGFGVAGGFGLDGGVLEDRFDDQVAAGERREVRGGGDAGEGGVALVGGGLLALDAVVEVRRRRGLCRGRRRPGRGRGGRRRCRPGRRRWRCRRPSCRRRGRRASSPSRRGGRGGRRPSPAPAC